MGSGVTTGVETGKPLAGLVSGATSAAGTALGSQLLGPSIGSLGSGIDAISGGQTSGFLGQPVAKSLGDTALSGVGSAFGSSTPGDILGGAAGSGVAQGMAQSAMPSLFTMPTGASPGGWQPSQQSAMALPGSLSSYSSLNPQQQATNIASKGVFGGGNGPDEQNYFLNLVNRQLFDQGGNVASNTSGLAPVDLSYLNQLGISGSTPTDYLKGISQFGA